MFAYAAPQKTFYFVLLKKAYDTGTYTDMTDETRALFEEYGIKPTFVDGGENLYKVTYPKDISLWSIFLNNKYINAINE